jgi:thiol-disulfide isomerase/thioredoxin
MRIRWTRTQFLLMAAALCARRARAEPPAPKDAVPPLVVTVTDESGNPVGGANISRIWLWNIGARNAYTPIGPWKTGEDGAFRVGPEGTDGFPLFYPCALFATDAEGRRGAVAVAEAGKGVTLRLRPLTPVAYRLAIEGWEGDWPFVSVTVAARGGKKFVELASGPGGALPLPPGDYTLELNGLDVVTKSVPFTVRDGGGPVDLGTIPLQRSELAKRYGKPAPKLTITEARGLPATTTLADLKGRWVLVDFWGFWCPPCVDTSLPEAVALYDRYTDLRDRFEILAFHGPGANTLAELDPLLRSLVKNKWKGRDLPFPILMDATGATVRDWGVTVYPSTVLLDPEGRVVRGGSVKLLGEKLEAERRQRKSDAENRRVLPSGAGVGADAPALR